MCCGATQARPRHCMAPARRKTAHENSVIFRRAYVDLALAPSPRITRTTRDFEGIARVSAFPADRRVGLDGSLEKGAFATTIDDLRMVPSGFAASGRYALPNPAAARFVYIIVPGSGHTIDGGTVRPAYYQAGGGVEVVFVNGAPKGSVFKPYQIPEL
jgi:hypothetical protein